MCEGLEKKGVEFAFLKRASHPLFIDGLDRCGMGRP